MTFSPIRQSMTDDACEIVSALCQAPALTLQAILFITKGNPHATLFILEQMAVRGVAVYNNGLWQLTEAVRTSSYRATA